MAIMRITRGAPIKNKDAPVIIRVVEDDGRVQEYEADAGDFSRGVALFQPFSVSASTHAVTRPAAS